MIRHMVHKLTTFAAVVALMVVSGLSTAAPNFVDDNTALPAAKTDRFPVTNPTQQWSASDANAVFSALTDIRTVLKRDPQFGFNVRAFGAIPNDAIDDSAAINAAIAAAVASVPAGLWGATVYIPPGLYMLASQLVVPNGVQLRGDTAANTILRAMSTFNAASLIRNDIQTGNQEYGYLESLQIDGNRLAGAICSEAVVSWGSLFINSYVRNVTILNGSNVGLKVFARSSPGATGPVLFDNIWSIRNVGHNVLVEDEASNVGAFAGIVFINLTSEHQGSNSSAVYLQGSAGTHSGQVAFYNVHIEMGGTEVNRTGITIDGFPDTHFEGVQLQAGTPANITAGIKITTAIRNTRIQIKSVSNINLINPVLFDDKNSVTFGATAVPIYNTPDVAMPGQRFMPGAGSKSAVFQNSAGTERAWFDANGRISGNSLSGGAVDVVGDATNNRTLIMMPSDLGRAIGWFFPDGSAIRLRNFTGSADFVQFANNGDMFVYGTTTHQGAVTMQSFVKGSLAGGTTCPSTGTHTQGEIQFFAAPTAAGFIGCVCTTGGTPGTWKTFGLISP